MLNHALAIMVPRQFLRSLVNPIIVILQVLQHLRPQSLKPSKMRKTLPLRMLVKRTRKKLATKK